MKTKLLYLCLFAIGISYAQIPTANLVGQYNFNNGTLTDDINNISLTKTGNSSTTIADRNGNPNQAIFLYNDALTRPDIDFDVSNANPYLPRTISFWLKTNTTDNNARIIYNDNNKTSATDTDFKGLSVYLKNGKVNAMNRVGTHGNLFTNQTVISDNLWHHVVIQAYSTQVGSQKRFFTFIFVDGVKTGATGYLTSGNTSPKVNKHIGNVSFSRLKSILLPSTLKYQEGIDDILFYRRILSDAEVNQLGGFTGTIYVNEAATGTNTGNSWANAYTDLQSALATTNSSNKIWVAKGTYKPSTTNRDASFVIKNNIYGGFAGTETTLADRDMSLIHTTNATILSGDLLNDDATTVNFNDNTRDDNSKHVVEITVNDLEINGLTIKDGYADATSGDDRFGAGIFKATTVNTTTIKNCIVKNNVALTGAGLSLTTTSNSNITIDACIIENNLANAAAGLDFHMSASNKTMNITITNTLFKDNKTDDDASKNRKGSGASAARLRAYFAGVTLNANIVNNTFVNNSSLGTISTVTDYPTIDFTRASGNFGTVAIANNIFWGNTKNGGATAKAIGRASSNTLLITNSTQKILNNIDEDSFSLISGTTATSSANPNLDSNFELTTGSPAIDSGSNTELPNGILLDLKGNQRIFNTTIDRGAYEFGSSPLGINNFFVEEEFTIYPNPTTTVLNIKMNSNFKNATIYSVLGAKVLETTSKTITTSNLKNGMYLIKIETENGSISTKRFFKQ